MEKFFILFAVVSLLSSCAAAGKTEKKITNFAECVAAGRPILETIPRRCHDIGQIFIEEVQPSNFAECIAAGYMVMESHPRQCKTADGQTFVEVLE
ncbi:MAG: hypothetical protein D3923_10315 [Candidatus Electrothrix sp. AR3]|nr:hypothetical protein [Candidatus Electrothrix sp. AR3]